jgi:hypothetical protein
MVIYPYLGAYNINSFFTIYLVYSHLGSDANCFHFDSQKGFSAAVMTEAVCSKRKRCKNLDQVLR